jgi:hypothetical protein
MHGRHVVNTSFLARTPVCHRSTLRPWAPSAIFLHQSGRRQCRAHHLAAELRGVYCAPHNLSAQKLLEVNCITFRAGNDNSKNNETGLNRPN